MMIKVKGPLLLLQFLIGKCIIANSIRGQSTSMLYLCAKKRIKNVQKLRIETFCLMSHKAPGHKTISSALPWLLYIAVLLLLHGFYSLPSSLSLAPTHHSGTKPENRHFFSILFPFFKYCSQFFWRNIKTATEVPTTTWCCSRPTVSCFLAHYIFSALLCS